MDGLPDWARGVGGIAAVLGGPAFAIWYAYHVTTRIIPDKDAKHAEAIKLITEGYRAEIQLLNARHAEQITVLTANFRADMQDAWKQGREDARELAEAMRELTKAINDGRSEGPQRQST